MVRIQLNELNSFIQKRTKPPFFCSRKDIILDEEAIAEALGHSECEGPVEEINLMRYKHDLLGSDQVIQFESAFFYWRNLRFLESSLLWHSAHYLLIGSFVSTSPFQTHLLLIEEFHLEKDLSLPFDLSLEDSMWSQNVQITGFPMALRWSGNWATRVSDVILFWGTCWYVKNFF